MPLKTATASGELEACKDHCPWRRRASSCLSDSLWGTGGSVTIKLPCRDTRHNASSQTCLQTLKFPSPNCVFFVYACLPLPALRPPSRSSQAPPLSRPSQSSGLHRPCTCLYQWLSRPTGCLGTRESLSICVFPSLILHFSFKNQDDLQVS